MLKCTNALFGAIGCNVIPIEANGIANLSFGTVRKYTIMQFGAIGCNVNYMLAI